MVRNVSFLTEENTTENSKHYELLFCFLRHFLHFHFHGGKAKSSLYYLKTQIFKKPQMIRNKISGCNTIS